MANPIITSYLQDTTIDLEKRKNVITALRSGQNEDELADILKTKYNEYLQMGGDPNTGARFNKTINAQNAFETVDITVKPEGIDQKVWDTLDDDGKATMAVNFAKLQAKSPERAQVVQQGMEESGKRIAEGEFLPTLGRNIAGATLGAYGGAIKGATETGGNVLDQVGGQILGGISPGLGFAAEQVGSQMEQKGIEAPTLGKVAKASGEELSNLAKEGARAIGADEEAILGGELVGYSGEQIAEFLVPASKISKAAQEAATLTKGSKLLESTPKIVQKVAPTIAKAGTEAAAYGGLSAAQEGEVNENVIATAALSGALPVFGDAFKGVSTLLKGGKEKAASEMIAKLIKPSKDAYTFGKNPNLAVAQYVPAAKSWDDLVVKVKDATNKAGQEIQTAVSKASPEATTSVRELMAKNLDDFKLKNADSATQKTYMQKMMDLVNKTEPDLASGKLKITGKVDIDNMNAQELWDFQKKLGSLTKWTGAVGENAANKSLHNLYTAVGKKLEQLAPGTKEAQFKYAELIGAQKAIEGRAAVAMRNTGILTSMIGGSAGASIAGASGGGPEDYIRNVAIGILGPKIYNSPAFRTTVAKLLAKEGVKVSTQESGKIMQVISAFLRDKAPEIAQATNTEQQEEIMPK